MGWLGLLTIGASRVWHLCVQRFRTMLATLRRLLPLFAKFLVVMLCVFYSFAMVGMEIFAGMMKTDDADVLARVQTTAYDGANYYSNNFDSLGHSMVTLFELVVVNNWQVFQRFVRAPGLKVRAKLTFILRGVFSQAHHDGGLRGGCRRPLATYLFRHLLHRVRP